MQYSLWGQVFQPAICAREYLGFLASPHFSTGICHEIIKLPLIARRATEAPGNELKHVEEDEGAQRSMVVEIKWP
ncbi:MAG: hypothetical protein A2161_04830 [Candidatus Schekmanbacteria bacterium RBG_13_48_7]|uniref:Uncharacterized protein n=1 Tax=Candidatus Schekmanbacteria bacterium RBG_13_48_7 TaxID=1817878 RepID=A0A1F7RRV9_9BACT|nr:MAG: hypothetical protein A2161_04830 [Candidatus Schekmanbacteria bacterium RBG_13_48_7]